MTVEQDHARAALLAVLASIRIVLQSLIRLASRCNYSADIALRILFRSGFATFVLFGGRCRIILASIVATMACQVVHGVQLRLIEGVHLQTLLLVEYLAQVVGKLVALALMS